MRGDAVGQIGFFGREEEQHAVGDEDRQARRRAQRFPFLEAVECHSGVDSVAAIGTAGHAAFAARTGAAVGRTFHIDQGYAMAGPTEMLGGPGAEDAGPDHRDMALCTHWRSLEDRRG